MLGMVAWTKDERSVVGREYVVLCALCKDASVGGSEEVEEGGVGDQGLG